MDIAAHPAGKRRGFDAFLHDLRGKGIGRGKRGRREMSLDPGDLGGGQGQRAVLDRFPLRLHQLAELRRAQRRDQDLDTGLVEIVAPALEIIGAQDRLKIGEQVLLG